MRALTDRAACRELTELKQAIEHGAIFTHINWGRNRNEHVTSQRNRLQQKRGTFSSPKTHFYNKHSIKTSDTFFLYGNRFRSGNWHTRLMISHKHHHHQKAIMFVHSLHTDTSLTIAPISHFALAINMRKPLRGFNRGLISSGVCRSRWGRAAIR